MSKYFINNINNQELVHGADIYSGYLNDKSFVEEIEAKSLAQTFFTIQFTFESIDYIFKNHAQKIKDDFIKLIIFDTYVGNNDRHFYNWGVVRHLKNQHDPFFSPIYDTARGLFWNTDETSVREIFNDKKRLESFIIKYCENSTPKIGWEGLKSLNHFRLAETIKKDNNFINCGYFKNIFCSKDKLHEVFDMIDKEFFCLMSKESISLIKHCLEYRQNRLLEIFN